MQRVSIMEHVFAPGGSYLIKVACGAADLLLGRLETKWAFQWFPQSQVTELGGWFLIDLQTMKYN